MFILIWDGFSVVQQSLSTIEIARMDLNLLRHWHIEIPFKIIKEF